MTNAQASGWSLPLSLRVTQHRRQSVVKLSCNNSWSVNIFADSMRWVCSYTLPTLSQMREKCRLVCARNDFFIAGRIEGAIFFWLPGRPRTQKRQVFQLIDDEDADGDSNRSRSHAIVIREFEPLTPLCFVSTASAVSGDTEQRSSTSQS